MAFIEKLTQLRKKQRFTKDCHSNGNVPRLMELYEKLIADVEEEDTSERRKSGVGSAPHKRNRAPG